MNRRATVALCVVVGALGWLLPVGRPAEAYEAPGCVIDRGMSVCLDLAYGQHSAAAVGSTQRLDLYRPIGPGPFPVIVWVHGGTWIGGNRKMVNRANDWSGILAEVDRGYAVASVDYRLASGETYYAQSLFDVKQAIRWLKWQAPTYGLSPTKVAVGGHSAGATVATLAASTAGQAPYEPTAFGNGFEDLADQTSVTRLAIGFSGVYDFTRALSAGSDARTEIVDGASFFLHCDLPDGTALWLRPCTDGIRFNASPIVHRSGPPVFLAHGDNDRIVPPIQAVEYKRVRDAAGQPTGLALVPGGGHASPAWGSVLKPWLDLVLDTYLKN
jgi:acetyl esterase/lipase